MNIVLHWDKKAVDDGLNEVGNSHMQVLAWLKELLDRYHGKTRPMAYYDLIAGDWLLHFSHLTYAAWQEVLAGNVPIEGGPIPVAATPAIYNEMRFSDGFHKQLRWEIASLLEGISPDNWVFECDSVLMTGGGQSRLPLRLLRGLNVAKPDILVTFPSYKCSHSEWASALWRWRRWLAWDNFLYPIGIHARLDSAWRKTHAIAAGQTANLDRLLRVLLPLHLPVALLEGFEDYRNAVLALPVARPKAVYSANALHSHLSWKLMAAEWRQQGTLLLYHQHGGAYGLDRIHAIEEFETRVSDRYYTWGWRRDESHIMPLSAAPPSAPNRTRKWLLLSCGDYPRAVYRMHFHPMPGTIETMHRETCAFLAALPDRKNLLVRPYLHDYGWGFVDMMRKAAPDAAFDGLQVRSSVRYAESRVVIHNYLSTGWLETLALDLPTVCFFDPDTYAFRESGQPYINALESVGVVHRSGVSAARFIANLGNDIEGWWRKPEVQEARRNFVERYANFSPDWKEQWEREFETVLDGVR